jgi:hypothetical protein
MACKYKVKGTNEWLSENDFKVKLSQGLLDNLIAENNIKLKGYEPISMKSQNAMPKESAPSLVEQTKQAPKAVVKEEGATAEGVSETKEKAVRRKPIAGIDKSSSPKAREIAEKLKFSPNEFKGDESPKDVGLVDTIEVFDKGTGRREVKDKPMAAVIRAAYDKGDITKQEATILEEALEAKKKAYTEAKANKKESPAEIDSREKIKAKIDEIAEGLKSRPGVLKSTVNPLDLLPPKLRNKAIDIAANLAKSGVDLVYALREAVGQVLADEIIAKRMTQKEAQKIMDNFPSEELLNPKGMSGIKKALTPTSLKEKAAQYTERMTRAELVEEGKRLVDSGEIDVEKMIDSIANGSISPNLSGEQVVALSYYKAKLDQEYRDLNKKLSEQIVGGGNADSVLRTKQEIILKEAELTNFYIIADITGAAQSVAFSARNLLIDNNYDAFFHINKAKSNLNPGETKLPSEVEEKFKELAKKYEELTAELNKKREEIEKLKNENIINNIKEENESIKGKNKQTGSRAQNVSSTNRKIKVPAKMIRDLVEGGIDNIEDLVDAVKANIADKFPDATTRDVRDAITNYSRTLNMNVDEVKKSIDIMKSVGRMLSTLEDLQNKIKKEKNKVKRRAMTDREAELKYQIQKALSEIPLTDEEVAKNEKERLESWKRRKENAIKMLTEKLNNKDYSKKSVKNELELDDDAKKLENQYEILKDEFELEHERFKISQRTKVQQLLAGATEIWNTPRALIASADLSAPLRQGLLPLVTLAFTKPKMAFKMFLDMHGFAFGKSEKYDNYIASVKSSAEYKLMKDAGLDITEQNAQITAREENVVSNWARRIPFAGQTLKVKVRGKERTIAPGLDITARSERGYSAFLNQLRIEMFQTGSAKLLELGYNPLKDKEVFKDLAHHINNSTGRGSARVKKQDMRISEYINSASRLLSPLLFSPKLIIARINTGFNPFYYARLSPPVRKMALKQIGAFYTLTALTLIAAKALDDDDDETWSVEVDPRSSDFAKIRIGKTTIDFTGGFAQYARFFTQSIGGRKKMRDGSVYKLASEYNKPTRGSVIGGFIMNKMSPWANYLTRKSMVIEGSAIDEEMEKESMLVKMAVPIWMQDVPKLSEEQGPLGAAGLSVLSFYGMGVQQETSRATKSKRRRSSGGFGSSEFGGGGGFGSSEFGRSGGFGSGGGF